MLTNISSVLEKEVESIYEAEYVEAKTKAELLGPKTDLVDLLKSVNDMSTDQAEALIDLIEKLPKSDTVICKEGEKKNEDGLCVDDETVKDGDGNQVDGQKPEGEEIDKDKPPVETNTGEDDSQTEVATAPSEENCEKQNKIFEPEKNECIEKEQ